MKNSLLIGMTASVFTLTSLGLAQANLLMTIEGAGVVESTVGGALVVEDFNSSGDGSYSALSTSIGEISGDFKVNSANQYGGSTGLGNYLFVNNGSASYTFDIALGYFGLWWSAGDRGNNITIETVGGESFDFNTGVIFDSGALTPAHYGNPTSTYLGKNVGEPYAFVNWFATDLSSMMRSITIRGTNFESDNHSVLTSFTDPTGTVIVDQPTSPVPEPTTMLLFGSGLLGLAGIRKRWQKPASNGHENVSTTNDESCDPR